MSELMRRLFTLSILILTLASCVPQPAPVAEPTGVPTPTALPTHAPEIRFALIGEPQDVNIWQLFDETGASYADYALRSEYWPRLYHLVPPDFAFQPLAADGMPSAVIPDGNEYSATVKLRPGLKWTDGMSFTAEDVAFTVNTSLAFELGYDWASYYRIDVLDRAEAIDPQTVKFYFKEQPNIESWQYGALQGPIVQKTFWESLLVDASSLLPDDALAVEIQTATTYLATVQARVDDLQAQANASFASGGISQQLAGELTKKQDELNYAKNKLDDLLEERTAQMNTARQSLYAIDDDGEPILGTWIPAGKQGDAWINQANPDFPFGQPNFDSAVYFIHFGEQSAVTALQNDQVDMILSSSGVASETQNAIESPTVSARFLIFNPASNLLSDVVLRRAIACLSPSTLPGFVLEGSFQNRELLFPCSGMTEDLKLKTAVDMLRTAGYSWTLEPSTGQAGSGLTLPDGTAFPRITLLSTLSEVDGQRAEVAKQIEQQTLHLGIPISVEYADLTSLQYAVYSSGKYDMAIMGWRLSAYPGYLCEWFGAGGQFENNSDRLKSACEALAVESDLARAQEIFFEIQSILMDELPFIPLYAQNTYDAFQNVSYPFDEVAGGLSGLYGAPSYAMPAK